MPFVIRMLGDKLYGLWILVGTFMGYYGFLDLGLTSAVQRFVSRAVGQKNPKEINEIINSALILFTMLGILSLCATIVVIFLAPYFVSDPSILFCSKSERPVPQSQKSQSR